MKHQDITKNRYQTALRRYVIDEQASSQYAAVFGLPIVELQQWLKAQLPTEIDWADFGKHWHLETVIPIAAYGKDEAADCYHFFNLRAKTNDSEPLNLLGAENYFRQLQQQSPHPKLEQFIAKIAQLKQAQEAAAAAAITFAAQQKERLKQCLDLTAEQIDRCNRGEDIDNLFAEQAILKRFGG